MNFTGFSDMQNTRKVNTAHAAADSGRMLDRIFRQHWKIMRTLQRIWPEGSPEVEG